MRGLFWQYPIVIGVRAPYNQGKGVKPMEFSLADFRCGDDLTSLRAALAACREHPGSVLTVPPGAYHISDPQALALEERALSGQLGDNPERVIFRPYYPHVKGLDFAGCQDVTVRAEQATFWVHGWMEPISLRQCQGVTLQGLTLDMAVRPFSEGWITQADADGLTVSLKPDAPLRPGTPVPRCFLYDPERRRFGGEDLGVQGIEWLGARRIRLRVDRLRARTGQGVVLWHSFHFRPAILIQDAQRINLRDVTIHSHAGMGIVGNRARDITLEGLQVVPAPGRWLSTNTDATHFTACEGALTLTGCQFAGQGDDAINVHGFYQTIQTVAGCEALLRVEAPTGTHAQELEAPQAGDSLNLVRREDLTRMDTYRVLSVDPMPEAWQCRVTLDHELPDDARAYYLEDIDRYPELRMAHCSVHSHLARSVLIKCRRAEVLGCSIEGCTGTAIVVAAEGSWQESGGSERICIRGNRLVGTGYGEHGRMQGACGIMVGVQAPREDGRDIHGRVTIADNLIEGPGAPLGIYVGNAQRVRILHNALSGCERAIQTAHCGRADLSGNRWTDEKGVVHDV